MFKFKTIDITPETDVDEVNEFIGQRNLGMYFIMDVGPNHKRLWASFRESPENKEEIPKLH